MHETKSSLTERGQISIPAAIRKKAKLTPGQVLRWEYVSDREIRIHIPEPEPPGVGAVAMIGFARKRGNALPKTTAEMLALLREGER